MGPTVHKMLYIAAYTCLFVYLSTEVLIEAICRVGNSDGPEPAVGIVQNAHKYKHTRMHAHTRRPIGGKRPALTERTRQVFAQQDVFCSATLFGWRYQDVRPVPAPPRLPATSHVSASDRGRAHVYGAAQENRPGSVSDA